MSRHLAVARLYWHHERESWWRFLKLEEARDFPLPRPYPMPCWQWWKGSN